MTESGAPKLDRWATWLTQGRDAGLTEAQRRATAGSLAHLAERVVDGADMSSGDRVLDVGAGTGLLSVPAATRVGPTGMVIALDVSGDGPPSPPTPGPVPAAVPPGRRTPQRSRRPTAKLRGGAGRGSGWWLS
ncbi:MAG TPA: hypothetical protein VGV93_03685 [Acidimicrobiales bacterium]|nr:hypothetical protein [Acidimicrobiales bacterium]